MEKRKSPEKSCASCRKNTQAILNQEMEDSRSDFPRKMEIDGQPDMFDYIEAMIKPSEKSLGTSQGKDIDNRANGAMKALLTPEKVKRGCNQRTLHDTAVMSFAWQYYYVIMQYYYVIMSVVR